MIAVLARISDEAYSNPELVKTAPHNQAVHRLKNAIDNPAHWAMTLRAYQRKSKRRRRTPLCRGTALEGMTNFDQHPRLLGHVQGGQPTLGFFFAMIEFIRRDPEDAAAARHREDGRVAWFAKKPADSGRASMRLPSAVGHIYDPAFMAMWVRTPRASLVTGSIVTTLASPQGRQGRRVRGLAEPAPGAGARHRRIVRWNSRP